MKMLAFFALLLGTLTSQALEIRSPKTMVFYPKDAPKLLVKFGDKLPLEGRQSLKKPEATDKATESCDIATGTSQDHKLIYVGHQFMLGTEGDPLEVQVSVGDNQYFVTPAYGAGMTTPFENRWWYCTSAVYETSGDCRAQTNAIRIQIGLYNTDKKQPVYTNKKDYEVGWERDTNKAYLKTGKDFDPYMVGEVIDWY